MGKGKQSKDGVFTVNICHDVLFICNPLRCVEGIKELKTDSYVDAFLSLGYENRMFVDLYVEHHDYVVLEFLLEETYDPDLISASSDEYCSDDESEEIDGVDFHTEGEHNVVIKNFTITDPFIESIICSMLRMIECQCWFYVEHIREINPEVVIPSSFQELEVKKGDQSYGVDLIRKQCKCRFWEISGIPCVHVVAGYMHLNKDPDVHVSQWSGIRMTCSNCLEVGHNKTTCDKDPVPKTPKPRKTPGRKSQPKCVSYASSRYRGRGSRGRGGGRGFRGAHAGRGVSGRGGLGVQPQQEDSVAVHMEEDVVEADVVDALIQD
nr:splicing factor [Tanacetum cinerariifolium]